MGLDKKYNKQVLVPFHSLLRDLLLIYSLLRDLLVPETLGRRRGKSRPATGHQYALRSLGSDNLVSDMPSSDSGEEANSVSAMFKAIQDQMAGIVQQNADMKSKIADLTRQSIATNAKIATLESGGAFSFSAPGLLPIPSSANPTTGLSATSLTAPPQVDASTAAYTPPRISTNVFEALAANFTPHHHSGAPNFSCPQPYQPTAPHYSFPPPSVPHQFSFPTQHHMTTGYTPSHSSAPRYHKLEFPTFDGTEDPLSWINRCEQFFRGQRTEESDKVWLASYHLTNIAQQWYFQLERDEGQPTWDQFKEFCHMRFGPPIRSNPLGELTRLQQTGSVSEY